MHDQELIMALAEGALDSSAEATARSEIAACDDCRLDLELQVAALEALHSLPPSALTELESVRMQRAVRSELGLVKEKAAFEPSQRRRMPLAAFATAAAVLLAVVVVGPTLDFIGGGSSDSSDATIAAGAAAATTLAVGQTDMAQGGTGVEPVSEAPAAGTTSETTARALVPSENQKLYGYYSEVPDLDSLRLSLAATDFDEANARSEALRDADDSVLEEELADSEACVTVTITSSDNFVRGFQVARGELNGRQVIYVVYLAEDLDESVLLVHAADNCEELARAGP